MNEDENENEQERIASDARLVSWCGVQTVGKLWGTLAAVLDWHRALPVFQQDRLRAMGFGDFLQLPVLQPDRPLLQALAELWDRRSNTFILPVGLLTISLEDVVRLTGLRV